MKTHQSKTPPAPSNEVAASIAYQITKIQIHSSHWLNSWFNAHSVQQKKRILLSFGLFISTLLIAGLFCPNYTLPKLSQSFASGHIGQPIQFPKHQSYSHLSTDSLTIKTKP